ncbi:MAG: flagellar type III secretion system pore protein FliP [Rhodobacteraceae bacterium]|nr:flagellar type III secretion system pore protein FliP [Paracoccaceae bacterium]
MRIANPLRPLIDRISAAGSRISTAPLAATALAGAIAIGILALLPAPAAAQSVTFDMGGDESSTTTRIVQLLVLMTILSLAPAIALMVTSFTRIVIVLSILRRALGTNTAPPNIVVTSLAIFMTAFIMAPTFQNAWDTGMKPMIDGQIQVEEAFDRSMMPFHDFMMMHVRPKDLDLFMNMSRADDAINPEDTPLQALVPAFMISELRRAFEIGFLIYVPFIIIDMVIASVLMSMGMMMLPPMMLALPFKLIFFVLIDGWYVLVGSLVQSFG